MQAADGEDGVSDCRLCLRYLKDDDSPKVGVKVSRDAWRRAMLEEPERTLLFRRSKLEKWTQEVVVRSRISRASSLGESPRIEITVAFTPCLCTSETERLRLVALDFPDSNPMEAGLAVCTFALVGPWNIVILAGNTACSDLFGPFTPRGYGSCRRT